MFNLWISVMTIVSPLRTLLACSHVDWQGTEEMTKKGCSTALEPSKGGNGIMPTIAPPSPERWSPKKGTLARDYLDEQVELRMIGGRIHHTAVMEEIKVIVKQDNPKAYVPSERLVFNYIRRQQERLNR